MIVYAVENDEEWKIMGQCPWEGIHKSKFLPFECPLRRKRKGKERQKERKRSLSRIWQGLLFPQECGKWGIRKSLFIVGGFV